MQIMASIPALAFKKKGNIESNVDCHGVTSLLSAPDFRNCLLLSAIPIAMSIVNSSWLYTPIGYLDAWYNVGYFLHYFDPTFLNSSYKIARLSWIIPGFVAYHIFQPFVANYLLHMGCLLVSVLFFYLTVARMFGSVIAFSTAACLALFTPYHGSGGWDYQNNAAGAFYIVAFYVLTEASLTGRTRTFIWAGAAYAAAIHAAISFINMIPILVLHCLTTYHYGFSRLPSSRSVVMGILWFLFGAIALTIFLGLVNVIVGRQFLFFKDLLDLVLRNVVDSQNQTPWWLPWSSKWFLRINDFNSFRVIFALLVGCIASTALAIVRPRFNPLALSLQLQYVFIAVLWTVWQSVGQTALQPDYFAYPIYPAMFFGLAGLTATWQFAGKLRSTTILFCGLLAVAATTSLTVGLVGVTLLRWAEQHIELALTASALAFVFIFAASKGRSVWTAAAVLAFCASNALGVAATGHANLYAHRVACEDRPSTFLGLIESNLFLTRFVPNSIDMFVWWNKNETLHEQLGCTASLANFALSMTSFGLQYLAIPWSGMPDVDELPANSISAITGTRRIAVLTNDYSNVERIIARYEQSEARLGVEGQTIIRTSGFSVDLYVLGPRRSAL